MLTRNVGGFFPVLIYNRGMEFKMSLRKAYKVVAILMFVLAAIFPLGYWRFGQELELGHYIIFGFAFAVFAGVGSMFFYGYKNAGLWLYDDRFVYKLFWGRTVLFRDIKKVWMKKVGISRYRKIEVWALFMELNNGRKLQMNIELFEDFQRFLKEFQKRAKKSIEGWTS